MVAELRQTDPLLELAVDGVVVLGVYRSESYIFAPSPSPVPIEVDFSVSRLDHPEVDQSVVIQLASAEDGEGFFEYSVQNVEYR